MKKLLILVLLLCGLYAQAGIHNSKDSFVDIHGGIGAFFIFTPVFSLGYGKHITNSSDSYLGFWSINWSMLTIFEAKYGYEFMRQNIFSFGLDISALISAYLGLGSDSPGVDHSFIETLQSGLGGGVGAYMQAGVTESISILLRTGGWVVFSIYPPSYFPIILPYIALGVRYHF